MPEVAHGLVDLDLSLLVEGLDEAVDGDEGAGAADAGRAVDGDRRGVSPSLVDALGEPVLIYVNIK